MELEPLNEEMTWAEFVELLTHTFEQATHPLRDGSSQGVMVFDVMAARGVPVAASASKLSIVCRPAQGTLPFSNFSSQCARG